MKERVLDMKVKRKSLLIALFLAVILGTVGNPLNVYAAEATVTFGSNWYNKKSGDTFPVGVYLKANAAIGDYHIEIEYDNLRLEYVDGADDVDEENGVLILEGNQDGRQIKFWIRFKAISGGEALIEISSAEAALRNSENDELFTITEYDSAPVHIKGTDTAAVIEAQIAAEAEREEQRPEQETEQGRAEIGGDDGQTQEETADEEETIPEASGAAGVDGVTQRLEESGDASEFQTEDLEHGTAESGEEPEAGEGKVKQEKKNYLFFNIYFVMILAAVLLVVIVDVVVWGIIKRVSVKQAKTKDGQSELSDSNSETDGLLDDLELIDLDLEEQEEERKTPVELIMCDEELEWQFGRPIIRICDVTMEFKMSSVNPSGLKEYIVQLLKREVSYRRLYALYHVSFNIYKGEVIGIIGTNGSGKSTLLKIVSGALKPTGGSVKIAGKKKVQLLTLGTGFDMELTARENVFLNGSIIGYRRDFLEEHYDEIVEFAELQDFMEEKVKNFSSGMVSRLGFAIATAGEAAEILILDEILSVGDEFFKEKSLKRIKEMIHGGSTVLMVSHSMGTILENCTRCVWIEKGELRMVGEPKAVCGEYRRLNG